MLKKYFSIFILLISILVLIFTFYRSEFSFAGTRRSYYITYYFLSLILFLFSISSFFFSNKLKTYFIILFIGTTLSLYLYETYNAILQSKYSWNLEKVSKIYKKETGLNYDKRKRIEIYNDIKRQNPKVVVTVTPKHFLNKSANLNNIFPLSGVSNTQTIYCNENGYYSIYFSDRYGFKNPDYEWDNEEIEYLLLGDSFTQGSCVNYPDDISSVLRTLSGKSTLNLGQGGNGTLLEYATLREFMSQNVKNIILLFYENDIRDLSKELKDEILKKYLIDKNFTQKLTEKQNLIDQIILNTIENEKIFFSRQIDIDKKKRIFKKFIKFIKLHRTRVILQNYLPKKNRFSEYHLKPQKEFEEILKSIKEISDKNYSNFYFVYLPSYSMIKDSDHKNNYIEIKSIVTNLGIKFIDIYEEVFVKESKPLNLFPFSISFGHYNVEGYKKVAATIYKLSK